MKKKKKDEWNDGYYIEAIDRTHLLCSMIEDFLLNHPASDKHPEIKGKIEAAQYILADVYQDFGQFI